MARFGKNARKNLKRAGNCRQNTRCWAIEKERENFCHNCPELFAEPTPAPDSGEILQQKVGDASRKKNII
jgi:hypothetical protein